MRISTNFYFENGLTSIQNSTEAIAKTQEQISTGKKVLSPSDDPVASTKILRLEEELVVNEQYNKNIDFATSRSQLVDGVLGSIDTIIQRIKELSIQVNSSAMGPVERSAIAIEMRQKQQELLGAMNTQDASGEFLFSGFQSDVVPFLQRDGGGYDYRGDEGVRYVQTSNATTVAVSNSGKSIFLDIPTSATSIKTSAAESNSTDPLGRISVGTVVNQERLDSVYPEDFIIEFRPIAESTPPGATNFSVYRRSDHRPVPGENPAGYLTNITYNPGMTLEFHGVELQMSGEPQAGDVYFIESTRNIDILTTIERLASTIENTDPDVLRLPTQPEVVGMAAPPRQSSLQAGNYIAEQTVTVTGNDGSVQYAAITAGDDSSTIATTLNGLTGVTATASATSATLDFSSTTAVAGDTIQFDLNGVTIAAVAGASSAATNAAILAAVNVAYPAPASTVTITDNGGGQFLIRETTGANIDIDDFLVADVSGTAAPAIMMVTGTRGDPVTLLEGGNDSTGVAANINIVIDTEYSARSSVPTGSGGIIAEVYEEDDAVRIFQETIDQALGDLDLAQVNVLETRTELGARLNRLESAKNANEDTILATQTFLSQIRDVDFAEAATQLSMQTFLLEAAQNSFVRITGLSLFNFLR